ncbi:hypothetical protein F511_20815 [Dorcoceras hygrometricum]|uniref:Uncharacterized protein n=1 Tax=Dorcoceras hygrometricum TaxID=472368 RepID=A0A2Z7CYP9_9LAMI|nr:hypothetical protein F511_20815 [Dorcoceras hygrometricum]
MTSAESVDGSAVMTSAVMSSQSAVEKKRYQQLIREAQQMERRRLNLNSEQDVAQRINRSNVALRRSCYQTLITRGAADQIRSSVLSAGS